MIDLHHKLRHFNTYCGPNTKYEHNCVPGMYFMIQIHIRSDNGPWQWAHNCVQIILCTQICAPNLLATIRWGFELVIVSNKKPFETPWANNSCTSLVRSDKHYLYNLSRLELWSELLSQRKWIFTVLFLKCMMQTRHRLWMKGFSNQPYEIFYHNYISFSSFFY